MAANAAKVGRAFKAVKSLRNAGKAFRTARKAFRTASKIRNLSKVAKKFGKKGGSGYDGSGRNGKGKHVAKDGLCSLKTIIKKIFRHVTNPDGNVSLIEDLIGMDSPEESLHPVCKVYAAIVTVLCLITKTTMLFFIFRYHKSSIDSFTKVILLAGIVTLVYVVHEFPSAACQFKCCSSCVFLLKVIRELVLSIATLALFYRLRDYI